MYVAPTIKYIYIIEFDISINTILNDISDKQDIIMTLLKYLKL